MNEETILGYKTLVVEVNEELKRNDKFKEFGLGDRYEKDYIISDAIYIKAYTNITNDNPHYIVLKRDRTDIAAYPTMQSDTKKKIHRKYYSRHRKFGDGF